MSPEKSPVPHEVVGFLDLQHASAGQLAEILTFGSTEHTWDCADLVVLWRQQLASCIANELSSDGFGPAQSLEAVCASAAPPIVSFGHLLAHVNVPPALLDAVRRWAKRRISELEGTGLQPIARVLYYSTIAAGVRCHHPRPTALEPEQFRIAIDWVCSRPWVDQSTRHLCLAAEREAIAAPPPERAP